MVTRVVHTGDGLAWLARARAEGSLGGVSIVTSLPDVSELPTLGLEGWTKWFMDAAGACAEAVDDDALVIFFQSDVKHDGLWVDKGALVTRAVTALGLAMVFHRIVLRVPAGTVTHGRAGYSHLLGFSRRARLAMAKPGCDVIPEAGPTTWTRGMGLFACRSACEAVRAWTPSHTVLDPFCGHGTVLAVANEAGLHAIGVDLGGKRAKRARALTVASLIEGGRSLTAPSRATPADEPSRDERAQSEDTSSDPSR